jgi:hypothetical protein
MEFYFYTTPGQSINRLAFPLRVVYDSLPEGVERRYMRVFCALVAAKHQVRIWVDMNEELSICGKETPHPWRALAHIIMVHHASLTIRLK